MIIDNLEAIHDTVVRIQNYNSLLQCGPIIVKACEKYRNRRFDPRRFEYDAGSHPTVTSAIRTIATSICSN